MIIEVGLIGAIIAGALSFLSPCVLPLVPPYLCYMAGISMEELQVRDKTATKSGLRDSVVFAAIFFVFGFTTVFVTLGASASVIGSLVRAYQQWFAIAAGIIIILMGLHFLGVFRSMLLSREARFQLHGTKAGPVGAYLMGLAFAFGWTPCVGPILGPLLTYAGSKETVTEGAFLLGFYSLGLGLPFILAAFFSSSFMRFLARFKVHLGVIEKLIGVLLIIAGILFLTGQMQSISYWLLEAFPGLQDFG